MELVSIQDLELEGRKWFFLKTVLKRGMPVHLYLVSAWCRGLVDDVIGFHGFMQQVFGESSASADRM